VKEGSWGTGLVDVDFILPLRINGHCPTRLPSGHNREEAKVGIQERDNGGSGEDK